MKGKGMEHRLANGMVVTDAELDAEAGKWERGEWEGHLEDVRVAVPERDPDADELVVVSFRIPRSRARAVDAATSRLGVSKSEFYRRAVDRELAEASRR